MSQLLTIETALTDLCRRVKDFSVNFGEQSRDGHSSSLRREHSNQSRGHDAILNAAGLKGLLQSYGIEAREEEIGRVLSTGPSLSASESRLIESFDLGGEKETVVPRGGGITTFHRLVSSLPFWQLVQVRSLLVLELGGWVVGVGVPSH